MVNGRRFCFEVNRKTASGVPGASICRSVKEIEHVLRNASQFPQVIKPEHGNSGHGFIRKTTPELTAAECIEIETSIQGSGSVIVEPWLNRVADVSTRCMIGPDGSVSALQHYRTCVNRVGAFDALWIDDDDPVTAAWHEYLDEKVSVCARTLAGAGYFGPAAFDSFIWREANGTEQCAAVIEINARYSMSWIAFALHERFAQNRVSLLHFLTKKQCRLPDTYALLSGQLGKDAYNPSTREGAILVTPLRVGFTASSLQQPGRNVFFIVARDSRQLFERDAMIRNRFAPKKK
jgi:hypothetical protein